MRAPLVVLLLVAGALAGCADPAPPAPLPVLPVLRLHLTLAEETEFFAGEVLGSPQGARIAPFRFLDAEKRIVAELPEGGARQLVTIEREDAPAELLADVTRATFSSGEPDTPAILEFDHDAATGRWRVEVVQPNSCNATVNANGRIANGTGPFELPPLAAGEFAVFGLPGNRVECARARVEVLALGAWTVAPLRNEA